MDDPLKFRLEVGGPVHIWEADLDAVEPATSALAQLLDPEETHRAARFHFEHDRRRFAAARGWLRALLGRYLEVSPTSGLAFGYGTRGKPFLTAPVNGSAADAVQFNVSHSHGRALFAFARGREVGIDLEAGERLGDDWPILARRIFSGREQNELAALPPEVRRDAFLNGWTRKEAWLKATGQGIVDGLQSIEVTLDPGSPPVLLAACGHDVGQWDLRDLRRPAAGFAAALVVAGRESTFERFECSANILPEA